MKLTPEQHAEFDREGYLFFPGLFTQEETQNLVQEVPNLYSRREAYNVREKGKDRRYNTSSHNQKLGKRNQMMGIFEQ